MNDAYRNDLRLLVGLVWMVVDEYERDRSLRRRTVLAYERMKRTGRWNPRKRT